MPHDTLRRALARGDVALLDNNRGDDAPGFLFRDPLAYCVATRPDEVAPALAQIEGHVRAGRHAAGYFAYELGYALVPRLARLAPPRPGAPLLCVGVYRDRLAFGDRELGAALAAHAPGPPARPRDCRLNMTKAQYLGRLERVKRHIVDGDTYQVNYTLKYKFRHEGAPLALFAALRERQRVEYGAYLDFPGLTVLSRSPELFFEKRGGLARTRPIKGTAGRGTTPAADRRQADALAADPKARAENVMIVDLLRNDLSRVGRPGTVEASDLFAIETYATLHQMVSTVSARVDEGLSLSDVLRHLFPCGSITGAPKVRTMELIRELEVEPRGVYTGAIGHLSPDGSMCFNVAIRTLALRPDGNGEMGVGGGIVHDSDPEAEYEECRLKGRFLTGDEPERPPAAPARDALEPPPFERIQPERSPFEHHATEPSPFEHDALKPPSFEHRTTNPSPFDHGAAEPSPLDHADDEATPPPPPALADPPLTPPRPPAARAAARLCLIDNHDSFTYNLARYLQELGADVRVILNDAMSAADVLALGPTHLVLSPGAGTPADAGVSQELLWRAAREGLPTLGVCLGHQVIGEAFGGRVGHARRVMHGKPSPIWHRGSDVFASLPRPFVAGRYHSLVVDRSALPDCLEITAWTSTTADGRGVDEIMGLTHQTSPVFGVQFHPESILSEQGHALLANFLDLGAGGKRG